MILGKPAPFVRAFVDAVDDAIRAHHPSHAMSATQRTWLAFCVTQKRREAPAFMPGRDRRWACWAQCPRAQQDPRSTRALNGRGNCREGSPGIHAGEDVPQTSLSTRFTCRNGPVPGKFITWRRL